VGGDVVGGEVVGGLDVVVEGCSVVLVVDGTVEVVDVVGHVVVSVTGPALAAESST